MSAPEKLCPKCGQDISDSYQGYDPDVGILSGGWYCEACEVAVVEEDDQDFDAHAVLESFRTKVAEAFLPARLLHG